MAFPKNFGNVLHAKRAIQKRGWNPLNYYLLTVLPTQEVVDLTTGSQENKENDPPPLPKINRRTRGERNKTKRLKVNKKQSSKKLKLSRN
jgi:hypothetical protein